MILTGPEIKDRRSRGELTIDPFTPALLNPNSYNYSLGPVVLECREPVLDPMRSGSARWASHRIPDAGFVLRPRTLYLGTTVERIGSDRYVPLLIGRSSIGRLGLYLQISADLGQLGAVHSWTLELVAVQPTRVYSGMRIGQVSFWRSQGAVSLYKGYFGVRSMPTVTPSGFNAR